MTMKVMATGRPAKGFLRKDPFPSNFPRLTNLKQQAPNFKTIGPTGTFGLSAHTDSVARLRKFSFRCFFLVAGALIKGYWSLWVSVFVLGTGGRGGGSSLGGV